MKVLVVIPTQGRRPEMLKEAIASAEAQTHPVEIAITCGHSSIADRLNAAIGRSRCDAFVILSDDDRLAPDFVEKTAAMLDGIDIVYTDCMIFGNRNCKAHALGEFNQRNLDRNTVPLITSLCRKSIWEKVGGFADVAFFDWDFWWRCCRAGASAYWLKEHLWFYREHESQTSVQLDIAEARRKALERFENLRKGQLCKQENSVTA